MSSKIFYRAAAILAALFCAQHSYGALVKTPIFSPQAHSVYSSMQQVAFPCLGSQCTWYGFYLGFGWSVSIFLLFAAFVAWFIGGLSLEARIAFRPVTLALATAFLVFAAICKLYFFLAPLVLSLLIVILLASALALDVNRKSSKRYQS